jgi:hypothetical protein
MRNLLGTTTILAFVVATPAPGQTTSGNSRGNVDGFINVSYSGQRGGGQDTVAVATPFIPHSDFDIYGVRAGLNFNNVQIAAFMRNFTDEEVEVLKFFQAGFPLSSRYNKPRTYGLSATYSW